MVIFQRGLAITLGFLCTAIPSSAATPQPVAEIALDSITTSQVCDASPKFLSDSSLSLLTTCAGSRTSTVVVLRLEGKKLLPVASNPKSVGGERIRAVSLQRVVVEARSGSILYSPDLRRSWPIPPLERLVSPSFPLGGNLGLRDHNHWSVMRLGPEMQVIREGSGQLLAVSDDVIVVRVDNAVHIEANDGRSLGSIRVPRSTNGVPIAEVAGSGRLFLDFGDTHQIVAFNGHKISNIRPPAGWGFRHGWSSDGNRLLFDHYTRSVPVLDRAIEFFASILVPIPEESNGEAVTAVDTATGKTCFHLVSGPLLFGLAGGMHADIAPSGRLVAVASTKDLRVFLLPETCEAN